MPKKKRQPRRDGLRSGYEAQVLASNPRLEQATMYEPGVIPFQMTRLVKKLPDLVLPNGLVVELKGRLTEVEKQRLLSFHQHLKQTAATTSQALYRPGLGLAILFQANNPVRKGARMRYTDWADKHGIRNAVGTTIPDEWWTL